MFNLFYWLGIPCLGCPYRDKNHYRIEKENAGLRKENSRLREIIYAEGINCGGSIYVEGQK
jgi:hypothetical protein